MWAGGSGWPPTVTSPVERVFPAVASFPGVMTRTTRCAAIAVTLLLGAAAPASAEIERKTTMSAKAATFAWDGAVNGAPAIPNGLGGYFLTNGCFDQDPMFLCDETLFKIEAQGTFTVSADVGTIVANTPVVAGPDVGVALYKVAASGVYPDGAEPVAASQQVGGSPVEEIVVKDIAPGYYLLEVEAYHTAGETPIKGAAALTDIAVPAAPVVELPAAPAPAPPAAPAPAPAPASSPAPKPAAGSSAKRAACQKKAKKIRNKKKRAAALKRCKKL